MSNPREHFALDWIKGELDQTLDAARQSLQAYAENSDDSLLRSCLTSLHQVHGTVLMLQLSGIGVLSGEMEELAQGLLSKSVARVDPALQALMQGILQLPSFLESIQSGAADSRRVVLPLANELRLLRGEPAFGDARAGLVPDLLASPEAAALDKFESIDGPNKAKRIRSAYQQVLLAIIKGEDVAAAVGTLNKVATGLEKICQDTPLASLWRAFNVFIGSLSSAGPVLDHDIVKLLRRLDAEMKALAQEGRVALSKPVPVELLQQLIDAAKDRKFESEDLTDLDVALEQRKLPTSSGRDAMQKAAIALRDELAATKDRLDLYVRSGDLDADALKQLAAPLKQTASTLSVLGFESSRAVVADQIEEIGLAIDRDAIDEDLLMRVAGALLQVDQNLMTIANQRPGAAFSASGNNSVLSEAQVAVLMEVRNGLEQIKQAVVDFAASQWDQQQLAQVPSLIETVSGALAMISLPRPGALLERCISYVQREWINGNPPDWRTLDTFADAVSGVDYYLERLSEEAVHPGDDILDLAEKNLAILEAGLPETVEASVSINTEASAVKPDGEGFVQEDGPLQDISEVVAEATELQPHTGQISTALDSVGVTDPEKENSSADSPGDAEQEIVEIFIEELAELLEGIDEWLPRWRDDLVQGEPLNELSRIFHTLKGSSRIVGAVLIGEAAWAVENMLSRVIDGTIQATAEFSSVVNAMRQRLPDLSNAFQYGGTADEDTVHLLMEQADMLASGGQLKDAVDSVQLSQAEEQAGAQAEEVDAENSHETVEQISIRSVDEQRQIFVLFTEESEAHLSILEDFISEHAEEESGNLNEEIMRAMHTLKGSAAIAGIDTISGIAGPLYEVFSALSDRHGGVEGEFYDYLSQCVFSLRVILDQLREGKQPEDESVMFAAEADRLLAGMDTAKSPLVNLPALSVLLNAHDFFSAWHEGSFDLAAQSDLLRALDEIKNEAADQEHEEIQALSGAMLGVVHRCEESELTDITHHVLDEAQETLLNLFDRIAAQQEPLPVDELVESLQALDNSPVVEAAAVIQTEGLEPETERDHHAAEVCLPEDIDFEILNIFFEEGDELLEVVDQSIANWSKEPNNIVHLENILRALHTLKGGARLAGLSTLGDASHDLESVLSQYERDEIPRDAEFFANLQIQHDDLLNDINAIKVMVSSAPVVPQQQIEGVKSRPGKQEVLRQDSAPAERAEEPDVELIEDEASEPVEIESVATSADTVVPLDTGPADLPRDRPNQEMVRVSAALLEELANLAGENSIVRARIEQGMNDFGNALAEMETTIERVREQLRRLEIETETQVLYRRNSEGPGYADFDPLEMDRYSHLQQLSRGLSESASDMLDLKDTLSFKARESETLLLQQARLNTELQEGLMRTRMVPFSRLLPRLRRIVRQVSRELNKKVEFRAYNVDGELDRSVLERMVPPLEHMLRNAIDHGIESTELRRSYGKPGTGRIELKLSREAGDVVVEISDDGRGIDAESVRAKAIGIGLMAKDSTLSDEKVLEFILAPGFSTAKTVTQISGRGVGLDVVVSEVKKLGGSIQIFSIPGKSTRFLVRIPFTVSVNRALMVTLAEDRYAIPLNNIEGIVRISQQEFRQLSAPDAPTFDYAGVSYRLRYLGNYLGRDYLARTDEASIPVVLVRSGDNAIAIHVDGVQGSREIVVKSLGPQFAGVGGISGATILGDGSVVVILDLLALIRLAHTLDGKNMAAVPALGKAGPRCVMIVDDSVTVRKVTSRLLERQGLDVLAAKDGVEAMALLQERRPDIMLLDIEMPRMDGFEVARQVRHDKRLSALPIIMITSRTGSKHKKRALELGVKEFLGKPFQESELLARIDELVSKRSAEILDSRS